MVVLIPKPHQNMKKTIRFYALLLTVLGFASAAVSCNTIGGMGQDIEHAGAHIEHAAH